MAHRFKRRRKHRVVCGVDPPTWVERCGYRNSVKRIVPRGSHVDRAYLSTKGRKQERSTIVSCLKRDQTIV